MRRSSAEDQRTGATESDRDRTGAGDSHVDQVTVVYRIRLLFGFATDLLADGDDDVAAARGDLELLRPQESGFDHRLAGPADRDSQVTGVVRAVTGERDVFAQDHRLADAIELLDGRRRRPGSVHPPTDDAGPARHDAEDHDHDHDHEKRSRDVHRRPAALPPARLAPASPRPSTERRRADREDRPEKQADKAGDPAVGVEVARDRQDDDEGEDPPDREKEADRQGRPPRIREAPEPEREARPADRPDPHPEVAEEPREEHRADDRPDRPTEVDRVARCEQAEPQPD